MAIEAAAATRARVLFVDDEADNLLVLKAIFRREFDCAYAASADEALDHLRQDEFAVVVTDQRMPGRSGVDLCAEIHAHWPATRRLVLTAFGDHAVVIDAINRGRVHAYLDKPWGQELHQMLRMFCAEFAADRATEAMRRALVERERLEAADALRRGLVHDLATATGLADLGFDAVDELVRGLDGVLDARQLEDARLGLEALRKGLDYIGALQARLRAAAHERRHHPEPVVVAELVQAVTRLGGAVGTVQLDLDCPADQRAWVDRTVASRILINLVQNAVQACASCGKAHTLRVWVEVDDDATIDRGDDPRPTPARDPGLLLAAS
jgi:CheY-like chemotaxis protein